MLEVIPQKKGYFLKIRALLIIIGSLYITSYKLSRFFCKLDLYFCYYYL